MGSDKILIIWYTMRLKSISCVWGVCEKPRSPHSRWELPWSQEGRVMCMIWRHTCAPWMIWFSQRRGITFHPIYDHHFMNHKENLINPDLEQNLFICYTQTTIPLSLTVLYWCKYECVWWVEMGVYCHALNIVSYELLFDGGQARHASLTSVNPEMFARFSLWW